MDDGVGTDLFGDTEWRKATADGRSYVIRAETIQLDLPPQNHLDLLATDMATPARG